MKPKQLLVIGAATTLMISSTLNASAAGLQDLFEAKYYTEKYEDLNVAFGEDEKALYNHYLSYGLKEGRNASKVFDVRKYREHYADLDVAFGDDWSAYYNHYLTFGLKEGRDGFGEFDAVSYANRYEDLYKAFGYDLDALYEHYLTYGIEEGRDASSELGSVAKQEYTYEYVEDNDTWKDTTEEDVTPDSGSDVVPDEDTTQDSGNDNVDIEDDKDTSSDSDSDVTPDDGGSEDVTPDEGSDDTFSDSGNDNTGDTIPDETPDEDAGDDAGETTPDSGNEDTDNENSDDTSSDSGSEETPDEDTDETTPDAGDDNDSNENTNSGDDNTSNEDASDDNTDNEGTDDKDNEPTIDLDSIVTFGVNTNYHTADEIIAYMNNSGVSSANDTSVTGASIASPYATGTVSEQDLSEAIAMLNQIRYIAGLDANVTLNEEYTTKAQTGSLVNAANATLSHSPAQPEGMSDDMYNLGYSGASGSNIAWSSNKSTLSNSILLWMNDSDASNINRVGHRRWILNPSMQQTGFGYVFDESVGTYSSMYAFDNAFGSTDKSGVAWPAREMPLQYFGNDIAWSYSYGQSLGEVTVTLQCLTSGKTQEWNFSSSESDGFFAVENSNYGKPGCVIFRPDDVSIEAGDVYLVTITNDGAELANYTVKFFE